MTNRGIFILINCLLILAGTVTADMGVVEPPETQGIFTSTLVTSEGMMTENDASVLQIINLVGELQGTPSGIPVRPPLAFAFQSFYVSSYSEDTIADQGAVSYTKQSALDTQAKQENQYNLETTRIAEFIGSDTGMLTSDESLLLDGAGTIFPTYGSFICPFMDLTSYWEQVIPPYCNVVEQGSSVDLFAGTLVTETEERHIMEGGGAVECQSGPDSYDYYGYTPVSDPGVEANYRITVSGIGDGPAFGYAEAYINAHIQEGRAEWIFSDPKLSGDLTYSERSTASGIIDLFGKDIHYESGVRRF